MTAAAETGGPVRVLYIAGSVRSGSTVLDKVLGELDGFFAGGEIAYVWERGLVENWLCGCGARFRDCPAWGAVLRTAFGSADAVDARRMIELQRKATRIRYVPRVVLSSRNGASAGSDLAPLRESLSRLYSAIRSTTRSRVIVDSSKLPGYGYLLGSVPGIDLRVVHLVRDPRAVAYSWMRKKTQVDRGAEGDMHRSGPFMSSILWSIWNSTAEALWKPSPERYLLLRYEDFVRDPAAAVRRIRAWLGEAPGELPFLEGHSARLGVSHTVAGNPNRLETGRIQIRPDLEWASRMAFRDRALVTGLTWPLLKRYRYPLRAATETEPAVT